MRNGAADFLNLAEKRGLVSLLNGLDVARRAERVDHAHRALADKPGSARSSPHPPRSRLAKVLIGGPRLPRISQFAEADFRGSDAVGETKERKAVGLADGSAGIRPQKRARSEQRILKTDPQAARAWLAVRYALEAVAERRCPPSETPPGRCRVRYFRRGESCLAMPSREFLPVLMHWARLTPGQPLMSNIQTGTCHRIREWNPITGNCCICWRSPSAAASAAPPPACACRSRRSPTASPRSNSA